MARKFLSGTPTVDTTALVKTDDSRLSDARTPTGSAGGDLTGTYPNPTIGAGKVTSSHILDGTIVDGDISGTAAISASKVSGTALTQAGPLVVGALQTYNTTASPTLDDYSLNAATTILRFTGGAEYVVNGLSAAGAQPADGRLLLIVNAQPSNTVTLTHGTTSSSVSNRIFLTNNASQTIGTQESALLVYDLTSSRWRLLNGSAIPRSTVTAAGDLIVGSANATVTKLASGASGTALVSGGLTTQPSWSTTINGTAIPSSATLVTTTRSISTTLPLTGGGDLSANRTLDINNFGGDAGSGGTKGTVPAPAAGDAAAGKFLKADATWATPAPAVTTLIKWGLV